MKKRSSAPVISCLLLGMIVFVMGVFSVAAMQTNLISKTKKSSMSTMYKTESRVIPPIDLAAPSNFQTATFGLG